MLSPLSVLFSGFFLGSLTNEVPNLYIIFNRLNFWILRKLKRKRFFLQSTGTFLRYRFLNEPLSVTLEARQEHVLDIIRKKK